MGLRYSPVYAIAGVVLLAALLGLLSLFRRLVAHRGMARLEALRARYGYPALIEAAHERIGAQGDAFSFVVLGDTRNNCRVAAQVYRQAAGEHPALIFHTGDIVRHGTPDELLRNHVALLEAHTDPAPMLCVPGNHERGARRDFAGYRALYGDTRFDFEAGGCLFAGINNSAKGRVTAEDFAFLRNALKGSATKHRFVFFHVPPAFFEAEFVSDERRRGFKESAAELHALFREQHVDEVFMAHIHGYASRVMDGVRYTLTAGGGAPLSNRLPERDRVYHYVLVHVAGDAARREVVRLEDGVWQRAAD